MPSLYRRVLSLAGRGFFSGLGAAAYYASGLPHYASGLLSHEPNQHNPSHPPNDDPVYILPMFSSIPDKKTAVRELQEMKRRLGEGNGRFRLGVSVFVRHMGDVEGAEKDYHFKPSSLEGFFEACISEDVPVFVNSNGVQWTEVAYSSSPLIKMLMGENANRVMLKDGEGTIFPAPRKRQPGFQDRFGLSYLCMYSPKVMGYWDRNLEEMAHVVAEFSRCHSDLFVGISTENETDMPGKWASGGFDSDYNTFFEGAYMSLQNEGNSVSRQEFRVFSVRLRNIRSANKLLEAGIPKGKIYTHISTEDAEARASPLEVGIVGSAGNLGVVWWGAGHFPADALQTAKHEALRNGKGFGILASNPLSFRPSANRAFLEEAAELGANPIVPFCWWHYSVGYGIKGLPLEGALRALLR